jgi:GGDEF domain-containing protein
MKTHIEGVQKQYQHYIMPTYNKVFFDKETGQYDVEAYDDHQEDMFEVAELNMRYFDVAFLNLNNAKKIMDELKAMATYRVFEDKDYKRYNFKR